jgi:hypothetical protein
MLARIRPRLLFLLSSTALVASCTGSGTTQESPSLASPPMREVRLAELTDTQPSSWASDASNWRVTLAWQAPEPAADHYVVSRDGVMVAEGLSEPTYTDAEVQADTKYRYEVVAVDAAGDSSRPAFLNVRTGSPPLKDARFEFTFDARLKPATWSGVREPPTPFTGDFSFEPICAEGSCNTRFRFVGEDLTGLLVRRGLVYSGTARGDFGFTDCYGNPVVEQAPIRFQITDAISEGDVWRVDAFEGTFTVQGAPVSGCQTGSMSWSVEARG